MSAITTFAFQNAIVVPRAGCACLRIVAEDAICQPLVPKVTPRWTVETDKDGTTRLIQHWFKNETTV